MESTEPPAPKVRRINKQPPMHVSECVRQFKLPKHFPSLALGHKPVPTEHTLSSNSVAKNMETQSQINDSEKLNINKTSNSSSILKTINKPITINSLGNNVNGKSTLKTLKLKSPDGKDLGEIKVKLLDTPNQTLKRKLITIPKSVIPAITQNDTQTEPVVSYSMKDVQYPGSIYQEPRIEKVGQDLLNKVKIISNVSLNKLPAEDLSKIIQGKQMIHKMFSNTPFEPPTVSTSKINNPWIKMDTNKVILTNSDSKKNNNLEKNLVYLKPEDHPYLKNITKSGKPIALKPVKLKSLSLNLNTNEETNISETNFISAGGLSGYDNGDMDEHCNDEMSVMIKNSEEKKLDNSKNNDEIFSERKENKEDLKNDKVPTESPVREWKKLKYTLTKKNVMVMLPKVPSKKIITNLPSSESGSDFGNLAISDDDPTDPTDSNNDEEEEDDDDDDDFNKQIAKNNKPKKNNNSKKSNLNQKSKKIDNESNVDMSIVERALAHVKDKNLREEALKVLATCKLGVERQIPIRSPSNEISIRETSCQTNIFGNLDPYCEEFIEVQESEKNIKKINKTIKDRSIAFKSLNYIVTPMKEKEEKSNFAIELDKIIMDLNINSEEKQEVENMKNILDRPIQSTEKINRVSKQIVEDIKLLQTHDESGLTGLHKAVMRNDIKSIKRLLMILRVTKNDVDIKTHENRVSFIMKLVIKQKIYLQFYILTLFFKFSDELRIGIKNGC